MIEDIERPMRRTALFWLGSTGLAVGAPLALALGADPVPALAVQAVGALLMLIASIVLVVTSVRVKGRTRDLVLAGTRALVARKQAPPTVPARVRSRGVAGAHPGFLAGATGPQDTAAVYLLLEVLTPTGRRFAGALVPRKVGLGLRRRRVVGAQWDADRPDAAVLDLRPGPEQLEVLAHDAGWKQPAPGGATPWPYAAAMLGGAAAGAALAFALSVF